MNKLKVATIVGTRPEIIRLSRIISKLDESTDHIFIHTGQNYDYELNEIFFEDLEIRRPDYYLDVNPGNSSEMIGQIISSTDKLLARIKVDAVLVLGDTNSCLATMAAKRYQIPIFHMEAGNRCFDQRVPEEINRKIVDHISDINLTYSDIAREYLLREGLPPDRIIKVGSPMFEVLTHYYSKIQGSDVLTRLKLTPCEYYLISAHRQENIEPISNFNKLTNTLNCLAESTGFRVIVSTHPRTRKRLLSLGTSFHPNVELLRPLNFTDYVKLQINSKTVLSDSGTITEESSILNFPALNLRETHERPEGMEEASVMLVGLEWNRVSQGLNIVNDQGRGMFRTLRQVEDYSMPNVSDKLIRIIHSYTDYVNRVVWQK